MFKQTIVAILLCQSILSPAAFALEITKKDSMSAALKSAVFPGWGQHENGESGKGINIISGDILMGGLYLKYSASVRDMESRNASVNDKWLDVTLRDYFLPDLLGNYFAGIIDAYFSAENINRGNNLEKKDMAKALWSTALVPGSGYLYVGDDIFNGVYFVVNDLYWGNMMLFGNTKGYISGGSEVNMDKIMGTTMYSIFWVWNFVGTYYSVMAHNERVEKLIGERKANDFRIIPNMNFVNRQVSIAFYRNF